MRTLVLMALAVFLTACTTLTPEKINQRVAGMNSFQLCLADKTGLSQSADLLAEPIVQAARERIQMQKIDCRVHEEEITRFLVIALQQEQRRNEQHQLNLFYGRGLGYGYGYRYFW